MSPYRKVLLLIVPLSFGLGAYESRKLYDLKSPQAATSTMQSVRTLALEGFFSEEVKAGFEHRMGVSMEIDTAKTPTELMAKLEGHPSQYDVAILFNWQLKRVELLLAPVDSRGDLRVAIGRVNNDLQGMPGAVSRDRFVALSWGIVGFAFNRARIQGDAPESWSQVFAQFGNRRQIRLLRSPIDLAWLAETRFSTLTARHTIKVRKTLSKRSTHRKIIDDDDDEGAATEVSEASEEASNEASNEANNEASGVARLQKPLAQIAALSNITGGSWRTEILAPAATVSGDTPLVVQMSQGEAAFWTSDGSKPNDNKGWEFKIPDEGGLLWTLSATILAQSDRHAAAESLIAYLLEGDTAAQLIQANRAASTNRLTEALKIDERLKPSYARRISLTKVHPAPAFDDDGAVLTMLKNK